MRPTFVDFSAFPERLANAVVRSAGCSFLEDHWTVDAGGWVAVDFQVPEGDEHVETTLKVVALASKLGTRPGYAPLGIQVNDEVLVDGLTIPGGGDLPQENVFAVPAQWLRAGRNTLVLRSGVDARSMLWLYRITLDPVYERDRSERELLARAADRSVLAFRTEHRTWGVRPWTAGRDVRLYIDSGESALPSQVAWRDRNGTEVAISFQAAMTDFYGHHRAADGTVTEYRGRLTGRWAFPEGIAGSPVHRFRTEEGWGGAWHSAGELVLVLDAGDAPVERVSWRDQRHNSGSVSVLPDRVHFLGYYQRVNEGPIGYRGAADKPAPERRGARAWWRRPWRRRPT